MRFSVYQVSRKGGREKNEDRMGYCYTREAGLFALADGMGGHPEGEVASQLALQTLAAMFQRDCKPTLADPLRFLNEAIVAGHHQLGELAGRFARNTDQTFEQPTHTGIAQGVVSRFQVEIIGDVVPPRSTRGGHRFVKHLRPELIKLAHTGVRIITPRQ